MGVLFSRVNSRIKCPGRSPNHNSYTLYSPLNFSVPAHGSLRLKMGLSIVMLKECYGRPGAHPALVAREIRVDGQNITESDREEVEVMLSNDE